MGARKVFSLLLILCAVLFASPASADMVGRVPVYRPPAAPEPYYQPAPSEPLLQIAPQQAVPQQMPQTQASPSQEYVLGVGDKIRLTVYGEADLSGDYEVGSTGLVSIPLIGDIVAAGQPLRQFEQNVRAKLAQGYLRDPRVNAQVVNYRPFFILGEVAKPGSYPYVNGMTVLNAVALAGGYTYRADKSGVTITRAGANESGEKKVPETFTVIPGDIIRVPERFF